MTHTRKFSKRARYAAVSIFIVVAIASLTAVACGHSGHMSPKLKHRIVMGVVNDVMDDIDATDAQRSSFVSAADAILKDALALKKTHKQHHKKIHQMLQGGNVDREGLKAHLNTQFDQLEIFAYASLDRFLDAYETLDRQQQQIVLKKLEKHMDEH